jgi:hypothetical protein
MGLNLTFFLLIAVNFVNCRLINVYRLATIYIGFYEGVILLQIGKSWIIWI